MKQHVIYIFFIIYMHFKLYILYYNINIYISICVYTEFQCILNPITVSVKINPSQPNYFSVPSITELAISTSDKTWKNLFWHITGAKVNYTFNFRLNLLLHWCKDWSLKRPKSMKLYFVLRF